MNTARFVRALAASRRSLGGVVLNTRSTASKMSLIFTLTVGLLALTVGFLKADETAISPEQVVWTKGVVCDTAEQVELLVREMYQYPDANLGALIGTFNETHPESKVACGLLTERLPMKFKETTTRLVLGEYDVVIFRVIVLPERTDQYMYIAEKRPGQAI